MREIKFRAWDEKNGVMMSPGSWGVESGTGRIFENEANYLPFGGDEILMQYTGLKDKNGKEIYEGDIVSNIYPGGEKLYGVVGWPRCIDCKETYELAGSTYHKMMSFTDCEVVGNIYENPKLVETP